MGPTCLHVRGGVRVALLTLALAALPASLHAQFRCVTNWDNTLTISGYTGSGGDVIVPAAIDGQWVTAIGDSAFSFCTTIHTLTISSGVTDIGNQAFYGCSMSTLNLPDTVTAIGDEAFAYCYGVVGITIPSSVVTLGDLDFWHCASLTSIEADPQNLYYSSSGGVLFDKAGTVLLAYPPGLSSGLYAIPEGVTNIAGYAFADTGLRTVTVPASVTLISDNAFEGSGSIERVYFTGDAPVMGGTLFDNTPTFYYLPGTSGWSPNFYGFPAFLWNPEVQPGSPGFGVGTNGFGFTITGTPGIPVVVQFVSNLQKGNWVNLHACTLTNGSAYFSDSSWTQYPSRFYRIAAE